MNPDVFAEWQRLQGYRVIKTDSSYWVESGPRIYQAFPYHWIINPSAMELDELLRNFKAIGLRYSTEINASEGMVSYHIEIEDRDYSLEKLPKKARHDVCKGIKQFAVERIPFAQLVKEGWELRAETLVRQGRHGAENREWWENLCSSANELPGFEAWAAVRKDRLAATLISFKCDDCISILYQQSRSEDLSLGVNNLLTFVFTQNLLSSDHSSRIFYGLHSLDAPASVDKFKVRMGYTVKPVRQRVLFHPWLSPLINRYSYHAFRGVVNLLPNRPILAKTEGMVRFYLEGKLPIENQPLQTLLAEQREEILQRENSS